MSYDIYVQDVPVGLTCADDIPDDFVPRPIGRRADILEALRRVRQDLVFDDSGWGKIDEFGYTIDVNIGQTDPVQAVAFHVRGADSGVSFVAYMLRRLGWRALTPLTESGLFGG